MTVVEIGDHCCGAPVGSMPVVGICADTNTSYDSAALDSDMPLPPSRSRTVSRVPRRGALVAIALARGGSFSKRCASHPDRSLLTPSLGISFGRPLGQRPAPAATWLHP